MQMHGDPLPRTSAKTYAEGKLRTPVFDGLDLAVAKGETVAILGASGAGKSTLLHLLGGLDTPTAGEVYVAGQKMSALSDAARGALRNRALGLRLPVPSPAAGIHRAGERDDAGAAATARDVSPTPRNARRRCWKRSASAIACSTSRASCPAASASAPRWRGRW